MSGARFSGPTRRRGGRESERLELIVTPENNLIDDYRTRNVEGGSLDTPLSETVDFCLLEGAGPQKLVPDLRFRWPIALRIV
jgi:hypothetical protein